jgi:hypothetical protein
MKLLDDIIEMASDNKEPIGALLRKCLVLERQIKNDKFRAWLDLELDGYDRDREDAFPDYRVFNCNRGDFLGMTVQLNNQPISLHILDERDRKILDRVHLHQPAASYDGGNGRSNDASIPWNQIFVVKYARKIYANGEPALIRAWQEIPGSVLVALLEQVRTRVLRFALDLKDDLPPEASTASAVPSSVVERSVINNFYGGNNFVATNTAQASQVIQQSIVQNDLPGLVSAIKGLGITDEGIQRLENSLSEPDKEKAAKSWVENIAKFVGKEGLRVGLELAKHTALRWISQFTGIPM